jgi:hypothetical protein
MKRKGNLYQQLCSRENIEAAFVAASKGKAKYAEVIAINNDPEKYINELQLMLVNKTFKTSEYEVFTKISGNKIREIYKLPFFPDRIVHHCIIQVVQKLWMSVLIRDTFSTIPGRGIHDGVRRVKYAMKDVENTRYCLKCDVRKYYPSIDHEILKSIIRRKIKDAEFLDLLDQIIDSASGIPIGNYVSQWFGNLYLAYFDHFIKEDLRCRYYFRYCDDLVILGSNKKELHAHIIAINHYLIENLSLKLKSNYQVFPTDQRGLDFLGYRFFHGYTLVRKRIVKAMKHRLNKPKSMSSYWGWLKHANTHNLTIKYFTNERKFKQAA